MANEKEEKSVIANETPTPEVKPNPAPAPVPEAKPNPVPAPVAEVKPTEPTPSVKAEENKPVAKKPLSKLRKMLIGTGSAFLGLALISLILEGMDGNGTLLIVLVVLMILALIATEVLSIYIFKKEPGKKVFPLVCLIICSVLLGIIVIGGIVVLFMII